jgi:hypothetical protein
MILGIFLLYVKFILAGYIVGLKGLSHQIRKAWTRFLSKALGWDMLLQIDLNIYTLPLIFNQPLKFLSILHHHIPIIFLFGT